jgi:cell wall-associated NlpC family hydrolase
MLPTSLLAAASGGASGKVNVNSLNLRARPSTSAEVLHIAKKGDEVSVLGEVSAEDRRWLEVSVGGKQGFMDSSYITLSPADDKANDAQADASAPPAADAASLSVSVAAAPPAETESAVVTTSALRMRAAPSTSADTLATAKKNERVTVLSADTVAGGGLNWYKVSYGGKEGFMSAEFLSLASSDSAAPPAQPQSDVGAVRAKVNLRSRPTTDSAVIRTIPANTTVNVLGVEESWYKVVYNDDEGYVHPDYLAIGVTATAANGGDASSSPPVKGSIYGEGKSTSAKDREVAMAALEAMNPTDKEREIVETALKYLGSPYVYGASGPKTFDCSGFTSFVMRQCGISIQRTASSQYATNGVKVSRDALRPGDLVFIKDREVSSKPVTHVGLYIGNGYFVHAGSGNSGSGKCVKVGSISGGYYYRVYYSAKRVI